MTYSVNWTRRARTHLAALWLQALDRRAVTAAQAQVDRLLAFDPLGNGVPVSEGLYAIDVCPLRALFKISDADRRVTVVSVSLLV